MVIETYAEPQWRNQYYSVGANPFNMDLCLKLQPPLSGAKIRALVEQEYVNLPSDGWPTFVVSDCDCVCVVCTRSRVWVGGCVVVLLASTAG